MYEFRVGEWVHKDLQQAGYPNNFWCSQKILFGSGLNSYTSLFQRLSYRHDLIILSTKYGNLSRILMHDSLGYLLA